MPAYPNQISEIQQLKQGKAPLADNIFLYINLYALPGTLQMRKAGFAHQPEGDEPPRGTYLMLIGFQLGGCLFFILFHKGCRGLRPAKLTRKRFIPKSLNLFESLLPLL